MLGILDLGQIVRATVGGLMLLLRGLSDFVARNTPVTLLIPTGDLRSYMARIGFFRFLPLEVNVQPALSEDEGLKWLTYKSKNDGLLEFTLLNDEDAVSRMADQVHHISTTKLGYSEVPAAALCCTLSEIGKNTFEHSGQSKAIVTMQTYPHGKIPRVELVIADAGQGIKKKLDKSKYASAIKDDESAINLAIQPRISSKDHEHAGNGLSSVVGFTKELNGILDIRSGAAKHHVRGADKTAWSLSVPQINGTQVIFSLPMCA